MTDATMATNDKYSLIGTSVNMAPLIIESVFYIWAKIGSLSWYVKHKCQQINSKKK